MSQFLKIKILLLVNLVTSISYCQEKSSLLLNYNRAATEFSEALPIGNGRLGAMVYGGIQQDKISLNEDTFWSGGPKDWNNKDAKSVLPFIREASETSKNELSDFLLRLLQGPYTQSYQPLGTLKIDFHHSSQQHQSYGRSLDLNAGYATVKYQLGQTNYNRTYFVSQDRQAIVIHLDADKKKSLSFDVDLNGTHQTGYNMPRENSISISGKSPSHVDPNYLNSENPIIYDISESGKGVLYNLNVTVIHKGGKILVKDGKINVMEADNATIYLTARTNFKKSISRNITLAEISSQVNDEINKCLADSYKEILKRHIYNYQKYFQRLSLEINAPVQNLLLSEHRKNYKSGKSQDLATLAFHFGRYLIISGSQAGTQALNLQGIWNESVRPPWSSNYTLNINTQMNYWPVLAVNLPEFQEPLTSLIKDLEVNGRKTAYTNYGMRGWVAHHNTDLWRHTGTTGDRKGEPDWANYAGAGLWMTMHLWEEYLFYQNKTFLKETVYPITRGSIEFLLDWLQKNDDGYYRPPYSVSTEASYINPNGIKGWSSKNTAGDLGLYKEILSNYISMCNTLNIKDSLYVKSNHVLYNLEPFQIDAKGRIKEWLQEGLDRPEGANRHHLTHLISAYPGSYFFTQRDQRYIDAVVATMKDFHPENNSPQLNYSGWTLAWSLNIWARLKNGTETSYFINNLLDKMSDNLFNQGNGFQIDANLGYVAGICESLVQSHEIAPDGTAIIDILPSIPVSWNSGKLKGIRTRGGIEVELEWAKGAVTLLKLKNVNNSDNDLSVIIRKGANTIKKMLPKGTGVLVKI